MAVEMRWEGGKTELMASIAAAAAAAAAFAAFAAAFAAFAAAAAAAAAFDRAPEGVWMWMDGLFRTSSAPKAKGGRMTGPERTSANPM